MLDTVRMIERLSGLGARPNAIASIMEEEGLTEGTVRKISRDYLGNAFAGGRRPSIGIASESGWAYNLQAALYYNIYLAVSKESHRRDESHAQAYELYHFFTRHLDEPKLSLESCISIIEQLDYRTLIEITCQSCDMPQLVTANTVSQSYKCGRCRYTKEA